MRLRTGFMAIATAILLAVLVVAGPALAHAVFVSANPAPGAVLPDPPAQVRIVFSEPLNGDLSGIDLLDSTGSAVTLRSARVDPADNRAFEIDLPPLQPDRYTVIWHTVSLVDGHTRTGSYPFTVLEPNGSQPPIQTAVTPPPAQPPTLPDAVLALAAWLVFIGLALLAGPILVSLVARPPPELAGIVPLARLLRLEIGLGALFALAGAAMQLVGAVLPAGGISALGSLISNTFGIGWTLRTVAVLLLVVGWRSNWLGASGQMRIARAGLLGIALAATAATSHGAASAVPAWGFAFDLVHVGAVAVWVGGIIALAIGYRTLDARDQAQQAYRLQLLGRISILAGIAVPLVLLAGLGSAVIELARPGNLLDTSYGQALGLKLLLTVALLGMAGLNAFWLRPAAVRAAAAEGHLRRTVVAEAALAVVVVGIAATMSVLVPARSADATRAAIDRVATDTDPARSFSGSTSVGGAPVDVKITPATLGTNVVRADSVVDLGSQLTVTAIGPGDQRVDAELDGVGTQPASDGLLHTVYGGSLSITGATGSWQLSVALPGKSADGAPLLMPVLEAGAGSPTRAPTGPPVPWLALVAVAAVGATAIASARALHGPRAKRFVLAGGAVTLTATLLAGGALAVLPGEWGTSTALSPIDTGTATTWPFPTTNAGLMMPVVDHDGTVWVAEMNVNRLAAMDPMTRTLREMTFPDPVRSSMGVVVDGAGNIWVAQEESNALGRFDPATGAYTEIQVPTPVAAPSGIAIDAAGDIWFTELAVGKIGRYDPASGEFKEYALASANAIPYWLAVAPDGRVWFTELQGAQVGVVDPASGSVREIPTPGNEPSTGIAVDGSGAVWFATTAGSLVRLDPNGLAMTEHTLSTSNAYGVAISPDGTVWVGTFTDSIIAYDPQTDQLQTVKLGDNSQPWWPTVGPDGSVWVVLGAPEGNGLAQL
jgi:copper transport protein